MEFDKKEHVAVAFEIMADMCDLYDTWFEICSATKRQCSPAAKEVIDDLWVTTRDGGSTYDVLQKHLDIFPYAMVELMNELGHETIESEFFFRLLAVAARGGDWLKIWNDS